MAETTTTIDPRVRLAALCERVARLDYMLEEIVGELDVLATELDAPQADDPRVIEVLAKGWRHGR